MARDSHVSTQVALQCVHLGEHDVKQNVVNESRPGVAACAAHPTHGRMPHLSKLDHCPEVDRPPGHGLLPPRRTAGSTPRCAAGRGQTNRFSLTDAEC